MSSDRLRRLWPLLGLTLLLGGVTWILGYLFWAKDRGLAGTVIQAIASVVVPAAGLGLWLWNHPRQAAVPAAGIGPVDPPARLAHDDPPTRPQAFRLPRAERNVNFTGREELLDRVEHALEFGGRTALSQAITGLGGVGKTELVIEYAHRRRPRYDVVWSLRAETTATLVEDLRELADELALDRRLDGLADRMSRWFERHDRWLLIFDNAPDLGQIRTYLPDGPGHVLITSREQVWRQAAAVIEIDVWRPEESVAFLRKRLSLTDADEPAAAAVAQMLGHLPLALEQAAAYMEQTRVSCRRYVALLADHGGALLGKGAPVLLDYHHTVATTWSVALRQIRADRPGATELLELCAFLAPDAIPETLFRHAGAMLPAALRHAAADDLRFGDAAGQLARYSLVRREDERISVHRLVQQVVRDSLSQPERDERIRCCLRLIERSFAGEARDAAAAVPHALALTPHAIAVEPEVTEELLLRVAEHMTDRAQVDGARESLERASEIAKSMHGANNPEIARILVPLGQALRTKGDLTAAQATFERALAVLEPIYGDAHPDVVRLLSELGQTLVERGAFEAGTAYLERALRASRGRHGG
jgi:tetratricopeptide (TPR) repeat protein